MNIYISCDMEGTAGVCSWQQVDARTPSPEYPMYQRYMTAEVLAAIDGARNAGAEHVFINDSHGPMRNLLLDDLPADVRILFGNRKPLSMTQGLDANFGGVFFTGYHGGIGDADATLSHTYTPSVVYAVRINGMRCSEATLNAGIAGYYGVPVLLITGDRVTVESAKEQMPWITGAVVKESIGHYSVDSISPRAAQELIREKAAEAVRNASHARPFVFEPPITMEIDLARVEQADLIELIPGFKRTGARQVRLRHDEYPVVFKAFVAAFRMGALADLPS
ncbi:MAG TPA: M55 family metallopeptidase [Candidatus Baltobacteraceae bacterium]|jgi:D-amino peptidase|nr:M55 family metallopeptidase [Candidatus Baltobacteraceae bacterium]